MSSSSLLVSFALTKVNTGSVWSASRLLELFAAVVWFRSSDSLARVNSSEPPISIYVGKVFPSDDKFLFFLALVLLLLVFLLFMLLLLLLMSANWSLSSSSSDVVATILALSRALFSLRTTRLAARFAFDLDFLKFVA